MIDLDLALLNDKPTYNTGKTSEDEMSFHDLWVHSNRLSVMFMRITIGNNIKNIVPQTKSVNK